MSYDTSRGHHTISPIDDQLIGGDSVDPPVLTPVTQVDVVFGAPTVHLLTISSGTKWFALSDFDLADGVIHQNGTRLAPCDTEPCDFQELIDLHFTPASMPGDQETAFTSDGSGYGHFEFDHALIADFSLSSVSVIVDPFTGGGGIPEPTSWALMLAGFGLAGAALRRRPACHGSRLTSS
jgi:hypothetical protein